MGEVLKKKKEVLDPLFYDTYRYHLQYQKDRLHLEGLFLQEMLENSTSLEENIPSDVYAQEFGGTRQRRLDADSYDMYLDV